MPFFLQKSTLFVDGGYRQWVRCENPSTTAQVTYFVLKGQTTPASKKPKFAEYDIHDMGGNIKAWTHGKVILVFEKKLRQKICFKCIDLIRSRTYFLSGFFSLRPLNRPKDAKTLNQV